MDKFKADWLAQYQEDILEPELAICDAHHHLWDYPSYRYLSDQLLADVAGGHNVVSTIYMECMWSYDKDAAEHLQSVGETRFVRAVEDAHRGNACEIAKRMVGGIHLDKVGVAEALDTHVEANPSFRGIRHATGWHPSTEVRPTHMGAGKGLMADAKFRVGFAELGKRALSFDAWLYHNNIVELADLAQSFPDTQIILDHTGGPLGIGPYQGKQDEVFTQWKKAIDILSQYSNVAVKIGGLNMQINGYGWETKPLPPTSQELAEATQHYYRHTIEKFGVERCMWQSNFPVDKVSCSYDVLWNSFKRICSGFSDSEKAWLFHDTAANVYKF